MKNGSFCNKISDCIIVLITQHAAGEGGALFGGAKSTKFALRM